MFLSRNRDVDVILEHEGSQSQISRLGKMPTDRKGMRTFSWTYSIKSKLRL